MPWCYKRKNRPTNQCRGSKD